MWFRGKHGNRRVSRRNVLEVRLRTREARAARLRLVATAVGVSFAMLVAVVTFWQGGNWLLRRLVFTNPAFAVRRLQIDTGGLIPPEVVLEWAGVGAGTNLLALDLSRVQSDLELIPLVASAALQRVPPDTLRIRVVARLPVAEATVPRLRSDGVVELMTYYLDVTGHVLRFSQDSHPELKRLLVQDPMPRLTGLDSRVLREGWCLQRPAVLAALQLIAAFEDSPMFGLTDLVSLEVSQSDCVEVTTLHGARITFGLQDIPRQLDRWRAVQDFATEHGKFVATLDLSVHNHVPATLVDTAAVSPEAPKSIKNVRNRKRHV